MQYNKSLEEKYESLTKKNVDTGMGVERTIAILNNLNDNYLTDCFLPLIKEIEKISKKKYGEETPFKMVGHSQAAISVNELAGPNDKGVTFNGALFTKTKDNPNVTNYRTKNDLVSAFANPNDMRTLADSSSSQNPIAAHNIENIKQLPVFI
jgi:alanyl-tRNA synthetase